MLSNLIVTDWGKHNVQCFHADGRLLRSFGEYGTGNGQFRDPAALALTSRGHIVVCDCSNNRLQVFDGRTQVYSHSIGKLGNGDGEFQYPGGLAIDSNDRIYVADWDNNRMQVFDMHGNFLFKFGSRGSEDGQFDDPSEIALSPNGILAVADSGNSRIQLFKASDGSFVGKFSNPQLVKPTGVVFLRTGELVVSDFANHTVQIYE